MKTITILELQKAQLELISAQVKEEKIKIEKMILIAIAIIPFIAAFFY